jgi:hypothetical protein
MAVQFEGPFDIVPGQVELPGVVSLRSVIRSLGGGEPALVRYQLQTHTDVWFADRMPTPGGPTPRLTKDFAVREFASTGGTRVETRVVLVFASPNGEPHFPTASIRALTRSETEGHVPDRRIDTVIVL